MKKKRLRILRSIMKNTMADEILLSYIIFVIIDAAAIWLLEPSITSFGDAIWYCYAVVSTAGFGDMVATTFVTRLLSVILTVYSTLVLAIITGVVVNYYTQLLELKNKDAIAEVLDSMERLPELSKEELAELSERVKRFRNSR